MGVLVIADIQQFLEETKFEVTAVPADLEVTARATVFALIKMRVNVSGFTSNANTPAVVKTPIAMLVASWWYARMTAEDMTSNDSYAMDLRDQAYYHANMIVDGVMEI